MKAASKDGIVSADGKTLYFFGIIDFLTEFGIRKRLEHVTKKIAFGGGISAVPPV